MPDPAIASSDLFVWYVFFSVLFFVWGACIGSFLNVCIYRIPRELSVVKPRSHCPQCKRPIPWYLNIPLVSWISLRGQCAYCHTRISSRYILVELLVGVLFLLVWLKFEFVTGFRVMGMAPITDWRLVPVYWLFVSGLVLGTFVDFEHMIIPDRVSLGGIVAGLILSMWVPAMHGRGDWFSGLLASGLGAAFGWGMLWGVATLGRIIFRKDAMGFGDVKLIGAIGAFLGWQAVLFTIVASSLFGSIIGISLVLSRQKGLQSRIPYGPYLALGAVLWVFWGPALVGWYVNLFTPGYL